MARRDLRSHGSFSRVPVSLDPSGLEALRLLRDRLISSKPRTIHAAWQEKPMIVFTDGALEEDSKLGSPATLGGVCSTRKRPAVHPCLDPWFLRICLGAGGPMARFM